MNTLDEYKGHEIYKNGFGYFEAIDKNDCDSFALYAKTIKELKTQIDDKLYSY